MGAWIETMTPNSVPMASVSPLAWGRGLKHGKAGVIAAINRSPLAWGRGLKPGFAGGVVGGHVAPRVGAWIETVMAGLSRRFARGAPRVGAWIETDTKPAMGLSSMSPLAWGRGLKQS